MGEASADDPMMRATRLALLSYLEVSTLARRQRRLLKSLSGARSSKGGRNASSFRSWLCVCILVWKVEALEVGGEGGPLQPCGFGVGTGRELTGSNVSVLLPVAPRGSPLAAFKYRANNKRAGPRAICHTLVPYRWPLRRDDGHLVAPVHDTSSCLTLR